MHQPPADQPRYFHRDGAIFAAADMACTYAQAARIACYVTKAGSLVRAHDAARFIDPYAANATDDARHIALDLDLYEEALTLAGDPEALHVHLLRKADSDDHHALRCDVEIDDFGARVAWAVVVGREDYLDNLITFDAAVSLRDEYRASAGRRRAWADEIAGAREMAVAS